MDLSSPAFADHQTIPQKYTCKGDNVSPPLVISAIPSNTISLALIVDDPDAPNGTFVHWVVWGLPPSTNSIKEGASQPHQGQNGYGVTTYKGPCPPPGKPHRYFFKLYALDIELKIPDGSNKEQLEKAIKGHILEQAQLVGTFQR